MWLRPATPLSICFFIAFVLLLLSVLSTPVIKAIPLATFQGIDFGVFGYCEPSGCSGFTVGYNTDELFGNQTQSGVSLPSSTRTSLSSILIVHPVAAFLCLICTGLAVASHFHAPSHSPRYLLVLLLLTIPTLLVSLLAFLVDILLFIPHLQWGGWIVLAATIVIVIGIIMTCAMRRTLVSRRARKKRINENAEMNGENFYSTRTEPTGPAPGVIDPLPRAESPPPLSTGRTLVNSATSDKGGPEFATFELQKKNDDRQPLNPTRSNSSGDDAGRYYGEPGRGTPQSNRGPPPPRDQYGNPLAPGAYGQPLRHHDANGTMGSQGSRGPPPPGFRGRGGPRGGPMRGGPRGGYRGGPQGMRGPPPPGWNGGRGGMGPGPMMGRGQRGPPPMYGNDQYYGGPPPQGRDVSPVEGPYGGDGNTYRDVSPPRGYVGDGPIGQAIEMDAVNGMPAPRSPNNPNFGLRDSDGDVQGMVGLQQQRLANEPPPQLGRDLHSPTSEYSNRQSDFVPARSQWGNQAQQPAMPTYQTTDSSGTLPSSQASRVLSPIQHSPVELAAQRNASPAIPQSSVHDRKQSNDYYEDVAPQFAQESLPTSPPPGLHSRAIPSSSILPPTLTVASPQNNNLAPRPQQGHLDPSGSYEELPDGARSPAASDASHFTSVSQRPVNPNWHPPPGQYPPPQQRRNDVLLETNPDFGLPGVGPAGRGRGGTGMRGRGGLMGGPGPAVSGSGSRYPGPDAL